MTWYTPKTPTYGLGGGFMKTDNLTFYIKQNTPFEKDPIHNKTKPVTKKTPCKRKLPSVPKPAPKKVKKPVPEKKKKANSKPSKQVLSINKKNFI